MKTWIQDNNRMIRIAVIMFNILVLINHNIAPLSDMLLAILILSIPLALSFGFLTNLFVPSGSRREYYQNRSNNDYGE